jgi:hypothetical protein
MFLVVLTVLAAAATTLYASDNTPLPIITTVDGQSVSATGLTPGGAAAVLTSWRVKANGSWYSSQTWRDTQADPVGAISVTFDHTFPPGALVVVVDVSSGRVHLHDVGTARFERTAVGAQQLQRDDAGDVAEVLSPNESAFIMLVRPGEGIWVQIASDGGAGDDDGSVNGRVRTDPANLQPIAGSGAAPQVIQSNDLLFVMDDVAGLVSSAEVTP